MRRVGPVFLIVILAPSALLVGSPAVAGRDTCSGRAASSPEMIGTDQGETIRGTSGDDVIVARGGDDTVVGGGGDDLICGGDGADVIGAGAGDDSVVGGAGNDDLRGRDGNDELIGGAGDDILAGGRHDSLPGSTAGGDTASYRTSNDGIDVDFPNGVATEADVVPNASGDGRDQLAGLENVVGTPHDDHLVTDGEANQIMGLRGDDLLTGGAGPDDVLGGFGSDTLAFVGEGSVTVNLSARSATDASGHRDGLEEMENATGGDGNDRLVGDGKANVLIGGRGADVVVGGGGPDSLNGGAGTDTLSFRSSSARVEVDLAGETAISRGVADAVSGFNDVIGGSGRDELRGTAIANRLVGGAGNDTLAGRGGRDELRGGGGSDDLRGGDNADRLSAGTGDDDLDGGGGRDRCNPGPGSDTLRNCP